ncbi:MAG: AAA family ATPase [Candidatus Hodarchaeota archaeon]
MEDEDKYKIEKIGTPAGDAASAQSVVNAINYILLKLKELDDYYTDKLKYIDITSIDPIIEEIHEKLNDLKIAQDLFTQKLSELENKIDSNLGPQKTLTSSSDDVDNEITSDSQDKKEVKADNIPILQKRNLNELLNTILNLQSDADLLDSTQLPEFYAILASEDIKKSLEELGGYIDQKDHLGLIFSLLTLPDTEIPKNYKIMLYGPEGNGKTSIIHALAKKYGYSLILIDFSILITHSENKRIQKLISLFQKIKEDQDIRPAILFLDNLEMITGKQSSEYITKTLILEMEKINLTDHRILIVAATRDLDNISESVLKIFDDFIEFLNPDDLEKSKILRTLLEDVKLEENLDIDELANNIAFNNDTKDFSCSDLENIVKIVKFFSVKENRNYVTKSDFDRSLQKIKSRISLITQKKSTKPAPTIKKLEKIQVLEDEITNLKHITSTSKGILKHSLRLALSENFDFVYRLFNLYKARNAPFTIDEASKTLGITIIETKKILNKDPFRIIFPKIMDSYHPSFDQKMFDEISLEIGFGLQGD